MQASDWAYVQAHAGALRRDFVTRNYSLVMQYVLLHGRAVWVTVIFCLLAILTTLLVNPLCAYALSRYNLSYGNAVLLFLLATMSFPGEISLIQNFLLLKQFSLLNTYAALILPGAASGYSIFLMKGFFDSLPRELYEAGTIGRGERAADVLDHHAAPEPPDLRLHQLHRLHGGLRRLSVCHDDLPGPPDVDADGLALRAAIQRSADVCDDGRPDPGRRADPAGLSAGPKSDHEGYHSAELQVNLLCSTQTTTRTSPPSAPPIRTQHGLTIAYIKKRVGEGMEYANEVARAVLSAQGGYYQLAEMPEEFAGALGDGRLAPPGRRRGSLGNAAQRCRRWWTSVTQGTAAVRSLSLYALYAGGSLRTRQRMFVFDQKPGEAPFAHGAWQPEALPRFFKLRLDCGDAPAPACALGLTQGVVFFLAPQNRDDGRSLLATLARTPATQDLGARPAPTMMN